ncbi:MAG: AMIN domain-containing protein [Elusimicrobia bacterium]|nr:AMIN domain-containing protein [Elusimicrobiota bacterium]
MKKMITLLFALSVTSAYSADLFYLESVNVAGNDVIIKTNNENATYTSYLSGPKELTIDIANMGVRSPISKKASESDYLDSIETKESESGGTKTAKVLIRLSKDADYNVVSSGSQISVVFKKLPAASAKSKTQSKSRQPERVSGKRILASLPRDPISFDYDGASQNRRQFYVCRRCGRRNNH